MTSSPGFLYALFVAVSLTVAVRDVGAELFFKNVGRVRPVFMLFVACLLCQMSAFFYLWWKHGSRISYAIFRWKEAPKELLITNIFTFIALFSYLLAIGTSLGSGLNSVISFGLDPLVIALMGAVLLGNQLDRRFFLACAVSVFGVILLNARRIPLALGGDWYWGLAYCLVGTVGYAVYIVYIKILSRRGFSTGELVWYRFFLTDLVAGIGVLSGVTQSEIKRLPELIVFCVATQTWSIFAYVYCASHLALNTFVILSFLMPVMTYGSAWYLGMCQPSPTDLFAICLILGSVLGYEIAGRRRIAST